MRNNSTRNNDSENTEQSFFEKLEKVRSTDSEVERLKYQAILQSLRSNHLATTGDIQGNLNYLSDAAYMVSTSEDTSSNLNKQEILYTIQILHKQLRDIIFILEA